MIFELVKDFAEQLDAMPSGHPGRRILKRLDEAIRRDGHLVNGRPTTLFQCAGMEGQADSRGATPVRRRRPAHSPQNPTE